MTTLPFTEFFVGANDLVKSGYTVTAAYDKTSKKVTLTAANGPSSVQLIIDTRAIGSTLTDGLIISGPIQIPTNYTLDRFCLEKDEIQVLRVKDVVVMQGSVLYVR